MAGETPLTIIGNLTGDVEMRFTQSNVAVANFTVASTPRNFNKQSNQWEDGETIFMDCSVWREAAENVAESLVKGTRVVVQGRLKTQTWTDKSTGANRSKLVLDVDEVGPSLRYATAKPVKSNRGQGGGQGGQQGGYGQQQATGNQGGPNSGYSTANTVGYSQNQQPPQGQQQGQQNPWGGQAQGFNGSQGWDQPVSNEPPF